LEVEVIRHSSSLNTILVKASIVPYAIPGTIISIGIVAGFVTAFFLDQSRGLIAWSVAAVGVFTWGVIALLFAASDRTIVFNAANRQLEVYRHRFASTPTTTYPAARFDSVRLSKVRVRSFLLTRAELMTMDEPLHLIDHQHEATVRAVAATTSQAMRVPLIDSTKD
jgi:hypothetical protein